MGMLLIRIVFLIVTISGSKVLDCLILTSRARDQPNTSIPYDCEEILNKEVFGQPKNTLELELSNIRNSDKVVQIDELLQSLKKNAEGSGDSESTEIGKTGYVMMPVSVLKKM